MLDLVGFVLLLSFSSVSVLVDDGVGFETGDVDYLLFLAV